jgi:PAS domain S-box-containing protein
MPRKQEFTHGTGTWAARVTVRTASSMPEPADPAGSPAVGATAAHDAFFASLSRELRWTLDAQGRFVRLDGAWQSVLGWQPEYLAGWRWDEIVHPDDHDRVGEAMAGLHLSAERESELELRLALQSGGHRWMHWTLVAGPGPDAILGLGHERTTTQSDESPARRRLAERNAELASEVAALKERCRAVERFAAVAAHQLSEPLIVAESSAIMLGEELEDALDPLLKERLDASGRSAARARRLIDALLADARTADQPLSLRPVDVSVVLGETLSGLGPRMQERRVRAAVGSLPTLRTEPHLLSIIFENLLSNAVKYGPRSGGEVQIEAERVPLGWEFSIRSEGAPIDEEEVCRIFGPFRRAAGERRASGTGLGLTICARLVERLGGTIGVRPGQTGGNVFFFTLPDPAS